MPNFKPKTNKKIKFNKKTSITLDTKHKEFLNEFSKYEIVISSLENRKTTIKREKRNRQRFINNRTKIRY